MHLKLLATFIIVLFAFLVIPVKKLSIQKDHTFRISGFSPGGDWVCTAFVISDSEAVTARHCVLPLIFGPLGMLLDDDAQELKVIYVDHINDMAVIRGDFKARQKLTLSVKLAVPGDTVTACGFPMGIRIKRCATTQVTHVDLFTTRLAGPLIPGMSGGPVLNEEGQVVGINSLAYPQEMGGGSGYAHAGVISR